MLISFGGLPGAGKTTLASRLAASIGAVYLRIDTIEQAIGSAPAGPSDVGVLGYSVAYEVAKDNLRNGLQVVADSVNPLQISRDSWRAVGEDARCDVAEIEVVCSDVVEHRRRVESRASNIAGMKLPTWKEVLAREYDPWIRDRIVIDTAHRSVAACFATLLAGLKRQFPDRGIPAGP